MSHDTIHHDDINKSFHEAIIKNYQTLLSEQRALCGVKKHQFKLSDMKQIVRIDKTKPAPTYQNHVQMSYTIGDSLVDYAKRFAFYSHNIDDVLLTQEDISSSKYSSVFEFNFLFFINGYYIDDVQVLTDDNDTTFVLNISDNAGINGETYSKFISQDATVTVYIVPNFKITKKTITRGALERNKYAINANIIPDGTYSENSLIFMNETTEVSGVKSLCNYSYVNSTNISLDSQWIANRRLTKCYITILNIPMFTLLKDIEFSKDNQPHFQIPGIDALIPSDNIILIPYSFEVPNELTDLSKPNLSMYYPNIYKFDYTTDDNWDSVAYLGYFYDKSGMSEYDNKLKLFHKYIKDVVGAYNNDQISDYVKDFVPVDVKYYNELYSDTIHAPYTFAYKVDKFGDYTNIDPDLLINYLYTKLKGKMRHYIYMNKLDLSSRIRMDNSKERVPYNVDEDDFIDSFTEAIFDEPHYVFSLSKAIFGIDEEFRFYLDNLALSQNDYYIQDDVNWYHVYIPCSRVTSESVLEIEKFPKVERTIIIQPSETAYGVFDFKMPDDMSHIYMNTMHLYNVDNLKYLQPEDFSVTIHDDVLNDDITLVPGSRASITKSAKIHLHNTSLHGARLAMYVRTFPAYGVYDNELGGMCYFKDNVNVSKLHIRPYKNGVFFNPISFLRFSRASKEKFNNQVSMFINIARDEGDFISFDIMPFKNNRELFVEGEFCTEKGFVDTGDALSLPIDLKWYDVYVNGRKLNKSNIEIISPNKFFIKNIDSRKNLEIWIRGDAPQEFKFTNYDTTINDIIWAHDDFIKNAILDSQDIIDDALSDIFDELVINVLDQYKDFVKNVLEYSFINPNKKQLTPELEEWYPDLFDEHSIMYLDSNTYTDAEFKTFINSNVRYEEMKQGQYRYGFTPMHIGSHEDALPGEYMCDPLTGLPGIKDSSDETIIPGGSINRVVTHKNKFMNDLSGIGMSRADIYQLQFNDNITSKIVTVEKSLLDGDDITLVEGNTPDKISFSLDIDILAADSQNVMGLIDCDPSVSIEFFYTLNGVKETGHVESLLSALSQSPVIINDSGNIGSDLHITDISIRGNDYTGYDLANVKMILHSILVAF